MEDGIKPDPKPVAHALAALGAKTGVLFGDTVDDCRAAVPALTTPTAPPGRGARARAPRGADNPLSPLQ